MLKSREEQGRSCYGTNKGTNNSYNRGTALQRIRKFQFNIDKFLHAMAIPSNTRSIDFAMEIWRKFVQLFPAKNQTES